MGSNHPPRAALAIPRAGIRVSDYSYAMVGSEHAPRFEIADDDLSLRARVRRFVERHEPCNQRDVIHGVPRKDEDVGNTLKTLCDDGGPLVEEADSPPTNTRPAKMPAETGRKRSKNASETEAGTPETPAGSPGSPIRCSECGNPIGPTADVCGECRVGGAGA